MGMGEIANGDSVIVGLGDCKLLLKHLTKPDVNFKAGYDVRGKKIKCRSIFSASEWEKFISQNKTGIKARAIERQEDPALMKKHNVTGFPTVLLVDSKGNKVKEYKGPRTTEGLLSFCKGN